MTAWFQLVTPLIVLLYYALILLKLGKNEKPGPVEVRYEPPDGLSPAAARYVWKNRVDERTVAAVMGQLAAKGLIRIEVNGSSLRIDKTFGKEGELASLAPEERTAVDWLFAGIDRTMKFDPRTDSEGCVLAMRGALDRYLRNRYSTGNGQYVFYGSLLSVLAAFSLIATGQYPNRSLIFLLTASLLFIAPVFGEAVRATLFASIRDVARGLGGIGRVILGIVIALFIATPFGFFAAKLASVSSTAFMASVIVMGLTNFIAVSLLRRTTKIGLEARRQIAGYREFLIAVEQDTLDRLNIPKSALDFATPSLAFAIALEVKEKWGDVLANAFFPRLIT